MLWKFGEVASNRLEVSIAGRARRSVTGIFTRYPRTLTRREMTKLGVIPVTTPTRTLLDLAAIVDPATLEDALDDGIRHGLVTAKALLTRLSGTDPRGRCGLPVLEEPAYQRVGRPLAGSRLETFVRRTFARAGLPTPIPAVRDRCPRRVLRRARRLCVPRGPARNRGRWVRVPFEPQGLGARQGSAERAGRARMVRPQDDQASDDRAAAGLHRTGLAKVGHTQRGQHSPEPPAASIWRRLTTSTVVNFRRTDNDRQKRRGAPEGAPHSRRRRLA